MNDQELLELAAKAIGGSIHEIHENYAWLIVASEIEKDQSQLIMWSPLNDDGDALRLAVKLRMDIEPWIHGCSACARVCCGEILIDEPHYGDDPERATRRAITRVAAEIGKAMP